MTLQPATDLAPITCWRDRATAASRDYGNFTAAGRAYAERPSHGNGEHTDYVRALHSAELAKAAAASRYKDWCDGIVGDLLADRDFMAAGGVA